MLWVSELTVARWPPCADVLGSAVRHLVFIYIYDPHNPWSLSLLALENTRHQPVFICI